MKINQCSFLSAFGFSLVVVLSLSFIAYTLNQQVKPNVRQVVEDTLAENANIIAQLIAERCSTKQVSTPEFDQKFKQHYLAN